MSDSSNPTKPLHDYFAGALVTTSLMSSLNTEVDVSDVIADAEQQISELMRTFVEGVHRVTQQTALHVLARQLGAQPPARLPPAKPRIPPLVQRQTTTPEGQANMAAIAATLKPIREKLEMTQKQMAKRIGCSQSHYTQWENRRVGMRGLKSKYITAINKLAVEAGVAPIVGLEAPVGSPGAFPSWLREIRAQLGFTQEQFAERLDVSFASANRWENGANMPSRSTLVAIGKLAREAGVAPIALEE